MDKIKFTGTNIAAAILVLFYFFPWVSMTMVSMSGASITSNGISPGLFSFFIHGFARLFMVLAILVPVSGALILYQNLSGNHKFSKYFKLAHILPAAYFIIGIVGLYFKMKPEVPSGMRSMFNDMSNQFNDMAPGVTDVLSFGVYLSLIASIYLALVSFGKIKDKEYYKYTPGADKVDNTVVNKEIPPTPDNQP
ncbi:MAG: hypothetical protein ABI366_08570 [Ginsengibacter sp.]